MMWFIKLLDKRRVDKHHPYGNKIALVKCDVCGVEYEMLFYNLKRWCTCKKCGRMKAREKITTHGESKTRLYRIWKWIKKRCYNKNSLGYQLYWWRWIECLRKNYEDFKKDMGVSYEDHVKKFGESETSIDRIDPNWNYCKENCRWATCYQQSNNCRSNKHIEYWWKVYNSLSELCRLIGKNYNTVYWRIYTYWWSVEDAIEK